MLELEQKLSITIVYKSFRYFLIYKFVYYYINSILSNMRVFIDYNYNLFEKFIYCDKYNVYILLI